MAAPTDRLCRRWRVPVPTPGWRMPFRSRGEHAPHQAFPWEHLRSRHAGPLTWLPSPSLSVSSCCLSTIKQPKSQNNPVLLPTATSGYRLPGWLALSFTPDLSWYGMQTEGVGTLASATQAGMLLSRMAQAFYFSVRTLSLEAITSRVGGCIHCEVQFSVGVQRMVQIQSH